VILAQNFAIISVKFQHFLFFYLRVSRVTEILGYKPVDLLGKLCYEFYSKNDVEHMMESFDQGKLLKGVSLGFLQRFV